jgi:hypothetical protein
VRQPYSSLVNNAVIIMNDGVNMTTEPEQPVVRGSSHEMLQLFKMNLEEIHPNQQI